MLKSFFSTLFSGLLFISGTSLSSLPIMANEDETEFFEETGSAVVEMYRLYNLNTGEHFYTLDAKEKDSLLRSGWQYEGIGWYAPDSSNTPVYRLYNRNASDHHYTADVQERDSLIKAGWQYEGVGWYSDDAKRIPLYRQYNPKARQAGAHNYTTSQEENDVLCSLGWKHEGIA